MKHSFMIKLTIISMSFAMMADSVVVPLVSQIFEAYPDAGAVSQNFIGFCHHWEPWVHSPLA